MKKTAIVLFILCPLLLAAWILLGPERSISENENRSLQTREELSSDVLSGDFQESLEQLLGDQFPGRDILLSWQSRLEYGLGKRDIQGAYIGKNMRLFEKITSVDEKAVERYAAEIRAVQQHTDCPVYVMPVPSAGTMLPELLPAWAEMYDVQSVMASIAEAAPETILLDVTGALTEAEDFYQSDHHWTSKGAYQAYRIWCVSHGEEPAPYRAAQVSADFRGSLYAKVLLPSVPLDCIELPTLPEHLKVEADGRETDFYDYAALETRDQYNVFQGGNHGIVTVTNEDNQGKPVILLVKDSFANSFAGFLTEDAYQVILLDPRYTLTTPWQVAEQYEADEILFLCEACLRSE